MKKVLAQFFLSFLLCSFALAEALTVTHAGSINPGGNGDFKSGADPSCTATISGVELDQDSTHEPNKVLFSSDGKQLFIANRATGTHSATGVSDSPLRMNRLNTPFDITTDRVKTDVNSGCGDLDGANPNDISGGDFGSDQLDNMHIANDGRTFFFVSTVGVIGKFNLSTPYDIGTMTYERKFSSGIAQIDSMHLSKDGKKLFLLNFTGNTPIVYTHTLPAPFDISSTTLTHEVDLVDKGIILTTGSNDMGVDIEFTPEGNAMFIMINNNHSKQNAARHGIQGNQNYIYQFRLDTNFDVSTAEKVGRFSIDFDEVRTDGESEWGIEGSPRGISFSADGMRLFVTDIADQTPGEMRIHQFDLECPYGIIECVTDPASIIGSTVQLSKQNINLNVSTIFKRFEWVKRNRDSENLNSFNINVKTFNPVLTSLKSKLKESKYIRQASITNKKKSNKKSTWSYWSHGDISIGRYEDTPIEKPKKITTSGITFGADKKFAEDKFFGLAIRYAENHSSTNSIDEIDMESLTLNLYGIAPGDEQRYINAVVGLSLLRFDHKHSGQITGERNGKQIFTAINFRNRDTYGDFNITPSGRLTYGLTHLSDFTNYISAVRPSTDVLYEEDVFENAEIAAGFLFDLKEYNFDGGRVNTNGGLEAVYDLTPDIKLEYSSQGSSDVTILEINNYSKKNIRANLGIETIYLNGFTFSLNYERFQHLDNHRFSHTDSLLIKLGHVKDEDSEFAFNFDPLINNLVKLSYVKDLHGFDIKLNSSYNFDSQIPEYGTDIEVSTSF